MTVQNPLPELNSDWKVIRRLSDVIFEAVDTAVQQLVDEFDLPDDEPTIELLTDLVYDLATGKEPRS